MTAPAEPDYDPQDSTSLFDRMSDSQKLSFLCEQVAWLTTTVSGLLDIMQQNPMARMMMGRKK